MLPFIIIILAGIALDQFTKALAVYFLSGVTTVPLIPNVLHLTYIENNGAAFSMLSGMQGFLIFFTIAVTLCLIYVFWVLPKTKYYFVPNLALSFIISGAIGNLIDRMRLQYVIDFVDFRIFGFAIFNMADVLVVTGTILLIVSLLRNKELFETVTPDQKKKTQPPVHKDVLKNLKPGSDAHSMELTPKVRTDLYKLPAHLGSVRFNPTPPEKTIPIPTKEIRKKLEEKIPVKKTRRDTPVKTAVSSAEKKKKNRYTASSDSYLESVRRASKENYTHK